MSRRRLAPLPVLAAVLAIGGCSLPFMGDDEGPTEAERLTRPPDLLAGEPREAPAAAGNGDGESRIRVEPRGDDADPSARLDSDDGTPVLDLPLPPDVAWTVTGRALERSGFAVDGRDAGARSYALRYDAAGEPEDSGGFLSSLAFWRDDPVPPVGRYRLAVEPRGEDARLRLLEEGGDPAPPEVARQVLTVLAERLRP